MRTIDINIEKRIHSILRKHNYEITDVIASTISNDINNHLVYTFWLKNIPGLDIFSSAFILSELDLINIECLSQLYNYCGLNRNNNFNNKLYRRLITVADYMIKKKSPYSLYYYYKYDKIKNKPDSLKSINSKIYMLKKFLKDLTIVYKKMENLDKIKEDNNLYMPKFGFTLVNYNDFIYGEEKAVNIQWKQSKLIKYRYRIKRFEK